MIESDPGYSIQLQTGRSLSDHGVEIGGNQKTSVGNRRVQSSGHELRTAGEKYVATTTTQRNVDMRAKRKIYETSVRKLTKIVSERSVL